MVSISVQPYVKFVSLIKDLVIAESAYSERYLGMPNASSNMAAYDKSSLLGRAGAIKGKGFFLAHGMADRNVHFRHSMLFAKELVEEGVVFQQQVLQSLFLPSLFLCDDISVVSFRFILTKVTF